MDRIVVNNLRLNGVLAHLGAIISNFMHFYDCFCFDYLRWWFNCVVISFQEKVKLFHQVLDVVVSIVFFLVFSREVILNVSQYSGGRVADIISVREIHQQLIMHHDRISFVPDIVHNRVVTHHSFLCLTEYSAWLFLKSFFRSHSWALFIWVNILL